MTKDEREKLEKKAEACKRKIAQIQEKLNDPEEVGWPCEVNTDDDYWDGFKPPVPYYEIQANTGPEIKVFHAGEPGRAYDVARLVRLIPVMVDLLTRHNLIHLLPE